MAHNDCDFWTEQAVFRTNMPKKVPVPYQAALIILDDLPCLPFHLHVFRHLTIVRPNCSRFYFSDYSDVLGV